MNWLIYSWHFFSKPSYYHYTQTMRARMLKFWENYCPHHASHVRCHVSGVICQVSSVIFFGLSGWASRWRVCYQQGLPTFNKFMLLKHLLQFKPPLPPVLKVHNRFEKQFFTKTFSIWCGPPYVHELGFESNILQGTSLSYWSSLFSFLPDPSHLNVWYSIGVLLYNFSIWPSEMVIQYL